MEIIATSSVIEENGGKIVVRHGEDEVMFHFSSFKKDAFEKNDVYGQLHRFWASKPLSFQKAVFSHYQRASELFFRINDKNFLAIELKKVLADLFKLHPFNEMREWLLYKSGVTLPDIDKNYVADTDREYTPEKTYIYNEYVDILTTAFVLRLAVPIWSYYIRIVKDHKGTGLKEHAAFQLLEDTYIYDSPAINKVVAYITANSKKVAIRSGALGILSPEDNPYWIMTQFCVRKLSMVEIQIKEPRATIVSLLYSFIKTANSEGNFQDRYKDKGAKEGGDAEDGPNKSSVHERHRNSTTLSIVEAAVLGTTLKGIFDTREKLFPWLPIEALQHSVETSAELRKPENFIHTALPCQRTILGWILSEELSYIGISYQTPQTIIEYLPLAEAVLWMRGYKYLSLLMTSRTPQDLSIHIVSAPPFRSRLSEENLTKIRENFPHVRVVQNRKSDPREECFVVNDIDALSLEITEKPWIITADESLVMDFQKSTSRMLKPIPDIRNELASLAVAIADESFYKVI